MGCDIHIRAEVREGGAWRPAGAVFTSDRGSSDYLDATRANLEPLTDGEFLDALAFAVGYHDDLRERLSAGARDAFALHQSALDRDHKASEGYRSEWRDALAEWGKQNPEKGAEYDGWVPDDHPLAHVKVVRPQLDRLVRMRRDAAKIAPEDRKATIVAVESYRPYGDDERVSFQLAPAEGDEPYRSLRPWDGRNYDLFAILADVRNGRGFAGVKTGEGFEPIADPRGVPEDAHPETAEFMDSYGCDGHSHSWYTLAQLRAYDWDGQSTERCGVVSAEVYERLKATGETPGSWSGGISGAGITTFSEEGYEQWKAEGRPNPGTESMNAALRREDRNAPDGVGVIERPVHPGAVRPYVRMYWPVTYREAAGERWFRTLDELAALVPEGGSDEDVRVVFFFDN